jgi:hypothetical protein
MHSSGDMLIFTCLEDLVAFTRPLMAGFPARWCVAGGWAIDLYLGCKTRDHADLELAVFRDDQQGLRQHLIDWEIQQVVSGQLQPWPRAAELKLPIHELVARSRISNLEVEFLLNERSGNNWVFRRNLTITLPIARAMSLSHDEIPFLAPEIVLLFKAKSTRGKDNVDFCAALPAMDEVRRKWLRRSLEMMYITHPWLERLAN